MGSKGVEEFFLSLIIGGMAGVGGRRGVLEEEAASVLPDFIKWPG